MLSKPNPSPQQFKRRTIRWIGDPHYRRTTAFTILSLVLASGLLVLGINIGALLKFPEILSKGPAVGQSLIHLILISSGASIAIILLFSIFVVVVYSHKIAGPMYRLEKSLKSLMEGDYATPITFRRDDEFQTISGLLNQFREKVRRQLPPDSKQLALLDEHMASFLSIAASTPAEMNQLKDQLSVLQNDIKSLQTARHES